ncbi:hypothetical protein QBC39DRAFT_330489 [Podospora conica]|nr:hypothetical protein QBC39DRAFT_330489 [Schizothecium conicum]
MHFTTSFTLAIALFHSALAQKGFHLMDREVTFATFPPTNHASGLWLVPSNQYNCNVARNPAYFEGPTRASDIRHGTVIKGQCGAKSINLYPVNNGRELEVWEANGRMYGKCYRQGSGHTIRCDGSGAAQCAGQNVPCAITLKGVWVCPVDLCGS